MIEFLVTHPSLFIISFTVIIIILIFIYSFRINSKYHKINNYGPDEPCRSIEMQMMSSPIRIREDEIDTTTPLPNPKLVKKFNANSSTSTSLGVAYEVPRVHKNMLMIPEDECLDLNEPSTSSSPLNREYNHVDVELNQPSTSHLAVLEHKYGTDKLIPKNNNSYETMNQNVSTVAVAAAAAPASPSAISYTTLSNTIPDICSPVIRREKNIPKAHSSAADNRISVSDVHKHGSYVSFEGEFDNFDDLSRASNVLTLSVYEPAVNLQLPSTKIV